MRLSDVPHAPTNPAPVDHPLATLTTDEIDAARGIAVANGLLTEATRFVYAGLEEAPKADILSWQPGQAITRRVRLMLLDRQTGRGTVAVIDVTAGTVVSHREVDSATEGQVSILDEEFKDIDGWLLADPTFLAALKRRGIDPALVRAAPLSAGHFGREAESTRRMARVIPFVQFDPKDLPWAHPIDGLVALVDLIKGEVFEVVDHEVYPVPQERGEWDAAPHGDGVARTDLKPIEITQPEGPSFTVEGNRISWADWEFRYTFDAREGMVLHQIGFKDGGTLRPILNRASVPEMVVPYGDPQPARFWINYFDQGEYVMPRYTNSLVLGCDCLGEIQYLDAVIADEMGQPKVIKNAICLHEEDHGVLWKHSDFFNDMAETRRQRRLVISFFVTIGNYDYGFYWYFYLDGRIELEVKATGVVFPSAYTGPDGFATEMAPGLGAPFHQHLFCARLDFAVDGQRNAVDEVDAVRVPISEKNPHGNAFRREKTRLTTEAQARRSADNLKGRHWVVSNPEKTNRLGQPVAYALYPEGQPALLADPSSAIYQRGAFARHHLWVTPYRDAERWPCGEIVNQSAGQREGLAVWTQADRPIDGEDIVVWHTFGMTHFPRPEDWPIMPVDYAGFHLKPVGFFDRNPTLNAPKSTSSHCHNAG